MRASTAFSVLTVAFWAFCQLVVAVPNDNTLVRPHGTCMRVLRAYADTSLHHAPPPGMGTVILLPQFLEPRGSHTMINGPRR